MAKQQVTLVHPTTGVEVTTDNAVEINDLRFGRGYRIKEEPPEAEKPAKPPASPRRVERPAVAETQFGGPLKK